LGAESIPIKKWPSSERPRERLMESGAQSLSDTELLAIVIGNGNALTGMNAVETARTLLGEFGSLRKLSEISPQELRKSKGIGNAKAATICAVFEISKRLSSSKINPGNRILSSMDAYESLRGYLTDLKKEHFCTILLNGKNRIIKKELISIGSLTTSLVHPREVFLPAIRNSAAAVIFLHNHPSGDPSPSNEDYQITQRLVEVGELLGIRVLDHIIVGSDTFYSFADNHKLNNKKLQGVN